MIFHLFKNSTLGWQKYAHASIGIDEFGASAPAKDLFKKFGLVPSKVVEKAKKVIEFYKDNAIEYKLEKPF